MLPESAENLELGQRLRFVPADGMDWSLFNPLVLKKGDIFRVAGSVTVPTMHPTLQSVVKVDKKVLAFEESSSVRLSFSLGEVADNFEIVDGEPE